MFTVIVIVAIIICVGLVLFILIQNPKGGGLSGSFGGAANQLFGYSRSADGIEKWTWYMIFAVFVLCLTSAAFKPAEKEIVNTFPESEAQLNTNIPTDAGTQDMNDPNAQPQEETTTPDDGTQ